MNVAQLSKQEQTLNPLVFEPANVFSYGVAVTQRAASGAVIWTRIASKDQQAKSINWEVYQAGDLEPLRFGLCLATADNDFAVHVPVSGLEPGRKYRFRFVFDGQASETGEFETLNNSH